MEIYLKKSCKRTFSQDRSIGRYTLPPRTTKRRKTTNLKTKNNQNCQKVELYGSLTTKELKKKTSIQTGKRGGDGQPGQRGLGLVRWQLADWMGQWLADQGPTFAYR